MNQAVVEAISSIIREKNLDRDTFAEIIESVFLKAIEKRYGTADNFSVIFNMEKGDIEIYAEKTVVEDGAMEDEATEIELSKALAVDEDVEVGEEFVEVVDYNSFGRRLVLSAKQNLIQKIKEIEKQNLYEEFSKRKGEIIIGDIHQINRYELRINVDKTEVVMPANEQIYNERYRRGQSIKAIIVDVRETNREPEVIVSRKSIDFVKHLFELEVPEIFDQIVEIKNIAREAGDRTKIAVVSNDRRVDPVGACVGMKGVRIQAIVRELNNEKIDIIHWTNDRELMVRRSLAPVIPIEIIFHDPDPKVTVVVPDDQMSMAIGRRGQNIRLASAITGLEIRPVKESEYYIEELPLSEVSELSGEQLQALSQGGFTSAEQVLDAGMEALAKLEGLDEESVKEILTVLENYFEEEEDEQPKTEESSEVSAVDAPSLGERATAVPDDHSGEEEVSDGPEIVEVDAVESPVIPDVPEPSEAPDETSESVEEADEEKEEKAEPEASKAEPEPAPQDEDENEKS
jgi:N utilization substance protein A